MFAPMRERLVNWLIMAALFLPPWNVVWWMVGAIYLWRGDRQWDTLSLTKFEALLFAPVHLPVYLGLRFKEWRWARRPEKRKELYCHVAELIADQLLARDIVVDMASSDEFGIILHAKVPSDKIEAYREVFAAAVRRFPRVMPAGISYTVDPLAPLDKVWAKQHRVAAWAEEIVATCVDCGESESCGIVFGQRAIGFRRNFVEGRHIITLKNGATEIVDGYICRRCLERLGWDRMITELRK
jgi:hypothetical protein